MDNTTRMLIRDLQSRVIRLESRVKVDDLPIEDFGPEVVTVDDVRTVREETGMSLRDAQQLLYSERLLDRRERGS